MTHDADVTYERYAQGLLQADQIGSERTIKLLDEVWQRIPEEDREILVSCISDISDEPQLDGPEGGRALGYAGDAFAVSLVEGVPCTSPWHTVIFLDSDALSEYPDHVAKAVIAHELAHILLRHPSMNHPFASAHRLSAFHYKAQAKVSQVHEWEADLQAWMWGFSQELRSLWEHLGDEAPPWYHRISLKPPE